MSLFDVIALAVLAISVVVIAIVIGRKFPTLASISTAPGSDAIAEAKHNLIEERLRRKVSSMWTKVAERSAPVNAMANRLWSKAHKKLVDLEHEYKVRSLPVFLSKRQRKSLDQDINNTLQQARAMMDDQEYQAAEDKIMQAVRLEPRSVPSFELLGELYMDKKEYGHAKEVYEYLLKLTGDTDAIYEHLGQADMASGQLPEAKDDLEHAVALNRSVATYHVELSQVYTALDDPNQAFLSIQEASRLEPNNPKVLDQYVETCIAAGKKQFAEDAVARIESVNPENTKIAAWREQIAAIKEQVLTTPVVEEAVSNEPPTPL